jgi:hemerythrin-like domain-containing protein
MKCTDLLLDDHKLLLRALEVLEQMAKRVENHEPLEHDDVEIVLRFLRVFGDDFHQSREESALFPELLRTAHGQETPLRQMLFEHDQERSLVEGLEDALYTKNGTEFAHFANRLVELLRSHVRKEDNMLFAITERLLSPEQDDRVVALFEKFQMNPAILRDVQELESKYMRKAA